MSKEPRLAVSEIFGPTIQGEGRHMGQISVFLRLAGCNLNCWWCDTPYTWAFGARSVKHRLGQAWNPSEEMSLMTIDEVRKDLLSRTKGYLTRLVITGGEPMLQTEGIIELLDLLAEWGLFVGVDIETAGTIAPTSSLSVADVYFTVSPKLASSRNKVVDRYIPAVLDQYVELATRGRADFKFVVSNAQDKLELLGIVDDLSIPRESVWIMPEGMTKEETIKRLPSAVDFALDNGFNVSSRLHVLVWDTKRGV